MVYFTSILLFISSFLGVNTLPPEDEYWKVKSGWTSEGSSYVMVAESSKIVEDCQRQPDGFVLFPEIIHGVHKVFQNGRLIFSTGDSSFKRSSSFYGSPEMSCALLTASGEVQWIVYSYSKYFSRFSSFPKFSEFHSKSKIFSVNLNLIATGGLLLLCFFSYYLFFRRMNKHVLFGLIFGGLSFAVYFAFCVAPEIHIFVSMLNAHKLADVFLLIGVANYFFIFKKLGFLPDKYFNSFCLVGLICGLIIATGENGDTVQFGTSMSLPVIGLLLSKIIHGSFVEAISKKKDKHAWLSFFSVVIIVLSSGADIFHIFGLSSFPMILPVSIVAGIFLLMLSANQQIEMTYHERDELLLSLERKVEEKTKDLTLALDDLKKSQADLVQSSKLASLGTLAAGIAHEINNSINFVNGAIVPLERKVLSFAPENEKDRVSKLFGAMKQGTDMTVQIVRSLRTFTGLNQAEFKDVDIQEVVDSVLVIIKSKLGMVKVIKEIEPGLKMYASQVGLSQVLMNLITNALDVVSSESGVITIKAYISGANTYLEVADNGAGMTEVVKEKLFDPFYTTKGVGKGTGLGLFIVKKEVDKHFGSISVQSEVGQGTCFKISIPKAKSSEVDLTTVRRAA